MQAKNIDEVINYLEEIIQQSIREGDPMGYFAAMYQQVTYSIKDGITCNYYLDCKRMEMLDVIFANRYFEAYTQFRENNTCTESWKYTFETAKATWPTVMQNLLLGINAHINLDLAIAAEQTCPGTGIDALKEDFDKINTVLAGMVAEIENDLTEIWPRLKLLLRYFGKASSFLIDFSMQEARNGAWKFATELALMDNLQKAGAIKERDSKVRKVARLVTKPGFFISFFFLIIRAGEIGSVAKKIQMLRRKISTQPASRFTDTSVDPG